MTVAGLLSRALLVLAVLCLPARAHEIQPAVADLTVSADTVEVSVRMTIEAPVSGVDLAGLSDTNDAAQSDAYDELRALSSEEMEAAFRATWPQMANLITLQADGSRLTPELRSVSVPDTGNPDLPRFSMVRFGATLPDGTSEVTFGWQARLGALILRQQGVEDGYTAFLQDGALSDPIPASEDCTGLFRVFCRFFR